MSDPRAAWLLFGQWKKNSFRKQVAWSKRRPIGVVVVDRELERAGIEAGLCSPQSAGAHDLVLVSLTSEDDVHAFRRAVAREPSWAPARRSFQVLVGGYGLQNPYPLQEVADWGYFGRAEAEVAAVADSLLAGRTPASDHVMSLREPHQVEVSQATTLYDDLVYRESFQGCPLRCRFCHFTFARRHRGTDHAYSRTEGTSGSYVQPDLVGTTGTPVRNERLDYVQGSGHNARRKTPRTSNLEVTWPQLLDWPHDYCPPRITVGIDGASERIRWLYGKRIARDHIPAGLDNICRVYAEAGKETVSLRVYDIAFPDETEADRAELHEALAAARPPEGFRLYVQLPVTPFHASPWTPMQWERFQLRPLDLARRVICIYPDGGYANYGSHMGPGAVAEAAAITRHDGSADARKVADWIALAPKWRAMSSDRKVATWRRHLPEYWAQATGPHPIDSALPTQLAATYVSLETFRQAARRLRLDEEESRQDPAGWLAGKRTLMGDKLPTAADRTPCAPGPGNEVLINLTPPQSKRRLRELGRL